jgi:hypothetical protein
MRLPAGSNLYFQDLGQVGGRSGFGRPRVKTRRGTWYNSISAFGEENQMSAARDIAVKGVESALGDAVSKLSSTYENCLIEANGNADKEAECKATRDRSLGFAKRARVMNRDRSRLHSHDIFRRVSHSPSLMV